MHLQMHSPETFVSWSVILNPLYYIGLKLALFIYSNVMFSRLYHYNSVLFSIGYFQCYFRVIFPEMLFSTFYFVNFCIDRVGV